MSIINACCIFQPSGPPSPPTALQVDSATSVSVTLSWLPGLDGGHPQTFRVLLHTAGTTLFTSSPQENSINDPGYGQLVKHTVTGLTPETHYQFKVLTTNDKGKAESLVNAATLG